MDPGFALVFSLDLLKEIKERTVHLHNVMCLGTCQGLLFLRCFENINIRVANLPNQKRQVCIGLQVIKARPSKPLWVSTHFN